MPNEALIAALNEWQDFVDKNEDAFVEEFCVGNTLILSSVYWSHSNMRVVYVLDCGQHVVNSVPMDDWVQFYNKHKR